MSCLGFLSPAQRAALRASSADGAPLSSFRSPAHDASKERRVRTMAGSPDPRIRESAALSAYAPVDVLEALAGDAEDSVRACVARNPRVPAALADVLAADRSAVVRGWTAANPSTPPDLLVVLSDDADPTVRDVVTWARGWERPPRASFEGD